MAYKRHCILTFTQIARVAAARHMRFDYVFLDRPRPMTGAISREARAQRDEYAPSHPHMRSIARSSSYVESISPSKQKELSSFAACCALMRSALRRLQRSEVCAHFVNTREACFY